MSTRSAIGVIAALCLSACGPSEIEKQVLRDAEAARAVVVKRAGVEGAPENGYACLASLGDVPEADLADFRAHEVPDDEKGARARLVFESEVRLMLLGRVPKEREARFDALAPWARRVRSCGEAPTLHAVAGAEPWTGRVGDAKYLDSLEALQAYTAMELQHLLGEKKPGAAAERCAQTFAVWLDAARLDIVHASLAHRGVWLLAEACLAAVDATPAAERERVVALWKALPERTPKLSEVLEHTRLATAIDAFGGKLSKAARTSLNAPDVEGSGSASYWKAWDPKFRAIIAETNLEKAEQLADDFWEFELTDAPPRGMSGLSGLVLRQHDDLRRLMVVLAALASGAADVPDVKRDGARVTFTFEKTRPLVLREPPEAN